MGITVTSLFTGIFAFFVILCFLSGLKRGMARAIFSLVLVLTCFILVLVFESNIAKYVMGIDVGGQTLKEMIVSTLAQDPSMESLVGKIIPLVEILIGIVAFVVGFIVLYIASRIIYLIGKLFIQPENKQRLLGGLIGLVQGVLIAFIICVPLNGLLLEVNKLSTIELEGAQIISLNSIGYDEYKDSKFNSLLTTSGGGLFKQISKTTTEDGKTVTLSGQVDTVVTAVKIIDKVSKLPEVDFNEGLTVDSVQDIIEILRELDEIKAESSDEVLETIDSLIDSAVDLIGGSLGEDLNIDISQISVKEIDFENEAVLIESVAEILETEDFESVSQEDVDEIIETFADSKLILPIIESVGIDMELPEEAKDVLLESIEKLDNQEQINRLKELFNIDGLPAIQ